ncbi:MULTISPECIES: hypothetical protein [Aerosakkonema]|uniref:hypothetical protein n=1 Tax=Aerosakkonema TaxID=1246629 RepID=UPI0035B7D6E3
MPLPRNEAEHIKRLYLQLHNPRVRRYFKQVPEDDIVQQGKASLKIGCLVRQDDSLIQAIARVLLFEITVGNSSRLQPPMYTLPVAKFKSETVTLKPQINLKFVGETDDENEYERGILDAEISFRLMWEESEITTTRLKALAKKIFNEFAKPSPFKWKKGPKIYSYRDLKNGYELRIYAFSHEEGRRVAKKILSIQYHSFEDQGANKSDNEGSFPVNPGTKRVLGKTVKKPRRRPTGEVRFHSAEFNWAEYPEPIKLVGPEANHRGLSPRLLYV